MDILRKFRRILVKFVKIIVKYALAKHLVYNVKKTICFQEMFVNCNVKMVFFIIIV